VIPESILRWNFGNASSEDDCKLDFDFFRVARLGEIPRTLGDSESPVSRYALRVNIVGVARPADGEQGGQDHPDGQDGLGGTQDEKEFMIEWFPGPESKVKNNDLVLLPRLPRSGVQPSRRFCWTRTSAALHIHNLWWMRAYVAFAAISAKTEHWWRVDIRFVTDVQHLTAAQSVVAHTVAATSVWS